MLERVKPIGFWSYARQDDEMSDGRLSRLRYQLKQETQLIYGKHEIQIFQDVAAIPPGSEWEKAIDEAIGQATFLIPILTPAFIESEWCCREVKKFLARETEINNAHPELRMRRRIFPVRYIDIRHPNPFDLEVYEELTKLQHVDFGMLRRESDQSPLVRSALVNLAEGIADLLAVRVRQPATPEELAQDEAAREKLASERRAAIADAAARRQKEVARRAAEEELHNNARLEKGAARERRWNERSALWKRAKNHLKIRTVVIATVILIFLIAAPVVAIANHHQFFDIAWFVENSKDTAVLANTPEVKPTPVPDSKNSNKPEIVGTWVLRGTGSCAGANSRDLVTFSGSIPSPDSNGWRLIDGAYWRVENGLLTGTATRPGEGAKIPVVEYEKC